MLHCFFENQSAGGMVHIGNVLSLISHSSRMLKNASFGVFWVALYVVEQKLTAYYVYETNTLA